MILGIVRHNVRHSSARDVPYILRDDRIKPRGDLCHPGQFRRAASLRYRISNRRSVRPRPIASAILLDDPSTLFLTLGAYLFMFGADVGEIPYLMSASITSERAMMTDDAMVATADDW